MRRLVPRNQTEEASISGLLVAGYIVIFFYFFFYIHFVDPVKRVVFTLGEMPAAVEMAAIIVIIQWYDVSLHKYG